MFETSVTRREGGYFQIACAVAAILIVFLGIGLYFWKIGGEVFSSIVDYVSVVSTLLLGIVAFQQSKKIDSLEGSKYDVYIGINGLDYSYAFPNVLVEEHISTDDFLIVQDILNGKKNFFTSLNIGDQGSSKPIFIPLSFTTKNQPLIVSLDFQRISLTVLAMDQTQYKQQFINARGPSYWQLENDSQFILGVGLMLPTSLEIDQLALAIQVVAKDQLERQNQFNITVKLKSIEKKYHLISSRTVRISNHMVAC